MLILERITGSVKTSISKIWGEAIFVVLILLIIGIRNQFTETLTPDDQNFLQNFFIEWFPIFYTIVLTVIIGYGWNKFSKINNELDREADSLFLLVQTGRMFKNENLSKALSLAVERYVKCVLLLKAADCRMESESYEKCWMSTNLWCC